MTSWNPNIPQVANVPANDAVSMQQNFSVLDSAFKVDHVQLSVLSNQGFHKQISFPGAGSSPYAVAATQNYAYPKLLASNVRSYLEYQPSGPDVFGGNPAVVPMSFKAYAAFVPGTALGMIGVAAGSSYQRRFNISSITSSIIPNGSQYAVVFNENMPDSNFFTIITVTPNNGSNFFTTISAGQTPNSVNVNVDTNAINQISLISFGIL